VLFKKVAVCHFVLCFDFSFENDQFVIRDLGHHFLLLIRSLAISLAVEHRSQTWWPASCEISLSHCHNICWTCLLSVDGHMLQIASHLWLFVAVPYRPVLCVCCALWCVVVVVSSCTVWENTGLYGLILYLFLWCYCFWKLDISPSFDLFLYLALPPAGWWSSSGSAGFFSGNDSRSLCCGAGER